MKIRTVQTIKAEKEIVWEKIADYANICQYHPLMKKSFLTQLAKSDGTGAIRHCDFPKGNFMTEEVVELKEYKHIKFNLIDSTLPLTAALTTIGLTEKNNRLQAYIEMEIDNKYLIIKPVMYVFFKFVASKKILKNIRNSVYETLSKRLQLSGA